IADGSGGRGAGENDLLDVGRHVEGDGAHHRIEPARGAYFGRTIAEVGDDVDVVAVSAEHRVRTRAAIQGVRPRIAVEDVGQRIAGAVDVGNAGEGQNLLIGAQRIADRRLDGVRACSGSFGDHVAGFVDDIGVVADPARHSVRTETAIEGVVAGIAGQHVCGRVADDEIVEGIAGAVPGSRAGQREVLEVRTERVAERRLHRIRAAARAFGD